MNEGARERRGKRENRAAMYIIQSQTEAYGMMANMRVMEWQGR